MDYITNVVDDLVGKYGTNEPFELADCLGLVVEEFPFKSTKGFIINLGRCYISISANLSYNMKRAAVAHEIGHYVLSNPNSGYFFLSEYTLLEPKVESEANRFMFHLLTYGTSIEPEESLVFYSRRVGIPLEMMRRYYNK